MKEIVTDIIKLIVDDSACSSGLLINKIDNELYKVVISVPPLSDIIYSDLDVDILKEELSYNDFQNGLQKSDKNILFRKEFLNGFEFFLIAENKNVSKINHNLITLLENSVVNYSKYCERITYERYLSRTISFLDTIIFSSTPDGKDYYFITDVIEKIMGVTKDDIINHPIKIIKMINPEDYTKVKEFIISIRKGIASTVEYSMTNPSGNELYFKHSAFPVFEEGKLTRIDGIIYDVTREKQNQILLQKSEERLRTLFETADDLIFVLDFKGNFVTVNSNGALSLEYLPDELKGQHFLNFVSDEDKPSVVKSFQQILKSNRIVSFNVSFNSKYGKNIIFEINARSTFDNEKVEGMLGIGRDITERILDQEKTKELNNKFIEANRLIAIERDRAKQKISVLEELNRLKNEFVSNISHELRTPLASIIGFSETIDSDHEMPESMKIEFNQIILNEAKRLSKLINDVLDISKIEAGKITLNKMEFDVILLLSKVIEQMFKKAEEKNVVLSVEIPSEEVMLYLDKERIEQVFENILSNAIKFTAEGGRVAVFAQSFYKEFEVIISDTGIGIPKKDLPFIFQKFYRVSRPGSEIPGTGLGLALVKQIIDLHKGLITAQSEEDKGTTFIIKLPKIM
jgi:PAS domain S-box-containing protein